MKRIVSLAGATLLAACASAPQPRTPDQILNTVVEEYFDAQLELSPMNATAIGDTRYDDRPERATSPGYREKTRAIERAFLDRAHLVDAARLTPRARITYDIFTGERELA